MADTITVLDGIQFAKPDTADVWTLDGGGQGNEVVKSYLVTLPPDSKSARVIFNSAEATASAKYHARVKLTQLTGLSTLAKTANTQVMEWTTVTAPAVQESGDVDVSGGYQSTLHIDLALSSTTAVVAGIEVIVQVKKEDSLDEWSDVTRFTGPIGTGVKSDMVGTNNAAATTLGVTNPATGKLDHVGRFIFIEDTATIAQCEIAFLVSQTGD